MKFIKKSIYEVSYTVKNVRLNTQTDSTIFIEAKSIEQAKLHVFEAVENDTYRIMSWKITQKTLWKKKEEDGIPWSDLMPVVCIKERKNYPQGGVKGEKYFIQRSSIYMDPDGTAYGTLFEDNKGTMIMLNVRLDRFMSI